MIPSDLSYDFPQAAYLLFFTLPLLALFWILQAHRNKVDEKFGLSNLRLSPSRKNYWIRALLFTAAWIFAVLAMMQPKGNERYPTGTQQASPPKNNNQFVLQRIAHDIIFLVDASASMQVKDSRTEQTRLEYAKDIAEEIISRLKGENAAVYAFTEEPTKMSPLTLDYLFARMTLGDIRINEGGIAGTDFQKTLAQIKEENFPSPSPRLKTVIILSDGGDTLAEAAGASKEKRIDEILSVLDNASALNLRVYTVGMGNRKPSVIPGVSDNGKPVQSSLDSSLLQRISVKGRGQFYEANQLSLIDIAKNITDDMSQDNPFVDETTINRSYSIGNQDKIYTYYFYWPLGLSILCLVFAILFPEIPRLKKLNPLYVLLILSMNQLQAAELPPFVQEKINTAASDYEAGSYSDALDGYQSLVDLPLDSWKRGVLTYDQGTVKLAQKKYSEAITLFESISLDKNTPPLLRRRVMTNLALARLKQAESLLEANKEPELFLKAKALLRSAQDALQSAITADCDVYRLEGGITCKEPYDLSEISLSIRKQLASLFSKSSVEDLKTMSLEEGLAYLLVAINAFQQNLELEQKVKDPELRKNYHDYTISQADSWLPVWAAVKDKLEGKAGDAEDFATFEEARKFYVYAIRFLEKDKDDLSQKGLIDAKAKLDQLIQARWGDQSFKIQLQKLLNTFDTILNQGEIQVFDTETINTEFNGLADLIKDKQINSFSKDKLKLIKDNLAQSQKNTDANQLFEAKLYLLQARQELARLIRHLDDKNLTPEIVLKSALNEQHFSLAFNLAWISLNAEQKNEKPLFILLQNSQKEVLNTADPYPKLVKELQQKEFKQILKEGQSDFRCQCKPWDEVLPLFNSGYSAALKSNDLFKNPQTNAEAAVKSQMETIKDWEMALQKLQQPKKEEKPQNKDQPQQQQQTQTQEQNDQLPSTPDDVIRVLQDMQKADQQPIGAPQSIKQGSRPW